jgi:hypothetical protein
VTQPTALQISRLPEGGTMGGGVRSPVFTRSVLQILAPPLYSPLLQLRGGESTGAFPARSNADGVPGGLRMGRRVPRQLHLQCHNLRLTRNRTHRYKPNPAGVGFVSGREQSLKGLMDGSAKIRIGIRNLWKPVTTMAVNLLFGARE